MSETPESKMITENDTIIDEMVRAKIQAIEEENANIIRLGESKAMSLIGSHLGNLIRDVLVLQSKVETLMHKTAAYEINSDQPPESTKSSGIDSAKEDEDFSTQTITTTIRKPKPGDRLPIILFEGPDGRLFYTEMGSLIFIRKDGVYSEAISDHYKNLFDLPRTVKLKKEIRVIRDIDF